MQARSVKSFCLAQGVARSPGSILARCAALSLATLALATLALVARADAFVYWATGPSIARANLDGTGVDPSFIPNASSFAVAVDDAHIYWHAVGGIARANLDGTGVDPSFITARTAPWVLSSLAVDGEHVYWTSRYSDPEPTMTFPGTFSPPGPPNTGAIGRANLDGTNIDLDFIRGISYPGPLAVDATHIYWGGGRDHPAIGRAKLNGTGVHESFIAGLGARGVAVAGGHVYGAGINTIGRANLDSTGVDVDFIHEGANGVAVDATHIYWGGSAIGRANLDGTGVDPNFIPVSHFNNNRAYDVAVDTLSAPPSNDFRFGAVRRNRKRGLAKLTVNVPVGPGELKLARTPSVNGQRERVEPSSATKVTIKPRGKAKKRLNRRGKATVKAKVTYIPDGGASDTKSKQIKLVKR